MPASAVGVTMPASSDVTGELGVTPASLTGTDGTVGVDGEAAEPGFGGDAFEPGPGGDAGLVGDAGAPGSGVG